MTFRTLALAGALCCALGSPARADLLADLFGPATSLQKMQRTARLPPQCGRHYPDARPVGGFTALASYYGGGERLSARTATGERFNPWGLTAAHRSLPFGTLLNVCFARCVVVRVNDRGPAYWTGRSLDLSRGAASASGLLKAGVGRVRVAVLR